MGIVYGENKRFLFEQRVNVRIKALDLRTPEEYYRYLLYHPKKDNEFLELASVLTNNETYFFRELNGLKAFVDLLLTAYEKKKRKEPFPTLRVLSAGCSSGEELVSLAILLYEKGIPLDRTELWGIDLDVKMIEIAQVGRYRSRSFRDTPPEYLVRYFLPEGEERKVVPQIHKYLRFRWGNLVDPKTLYFPHPFDGILLRNVLIYFDIPGVEKVLKNVFPLLPEGGYLLIGLSESIAHIPFYFSPIRHNNIILYTREKGE
jgi:chemotaxis protein methyltransferase CheR